MQMENKYQVRVTDNLGGVRIVTFQNVYLKFRDNDSVVIYEKCTGRIKAIYPSTYSLEISDVTNGNTSD